MTCKAVHAATRSLEAGDRSLVFAVTMSRYGMDTPMECESTAALLRLAIAKFIRMGGTAITLYVALASAARDKIKEIVRGDHDATVRLADSLNVMQSMVERKHRNDSWILDQCLLDQTPGAASYLKFYRAMNKIRNDTRDALHAGNRVSVSLTAIHTMATNIEKVIGHDRAHDIILSKLPKPLTARSFVDELKERER